MCHRTFHPNPQEKGYRLQLDTPVLLFRLETASGSSRRENAACSCQSHHASAVIHQQASMYSNGKLRSLSPPIKTVSTLAQSSIHLHAEDIDLKDSWPKEKKSEATRVVHVHGTYAVGK